MSAILQTVDISHRYGGVAALQDVCIRLAAGTVTCLVGGNGAGKSTLIRILAGALAPTSGRILLDGAAVAFDSPREARGRGVATVYQDLALVPLLSVWRNFVLGDEPVRGPGFFGALDVAAARAAASTELQRFSLDLDLDRPAGQLSGGQRQVLAIARALHFGARVLILVEPTASLAVDQTRRVLDAVRASRDRGCAVLFVIYNPRHALEVADRIVVLQLGRVVADESADAVDESSLGALIATGP